MSPSSLPDFSQHGHGPHLTSKATGVKTSKRPEVKSGKKRKADDPVLATKARFVREDIELIVAWLEIKENFVKIYGISGKQRVGPAPMRQIQGFAALATHFNCVNKNGFNLDPKAMKERFNRYYKTYLSVREESQRTGFGVTEEDRARGYFRIEDVLEHKCFCFKRMDDIFGERANVKPLDFFGSVTSDEDPAARSASVELLDSMLEDFDDFSAEIERDTANTFQENEEMGQADSGKDDDDEIAPLTSAADQQDSSTSNSRSRGKDQRKAPPRVVTGTIIATKNPIDIIEKVTANINKGTIAVWCILGKCK